MVKMAAFASSTSNSSLNNTKYLKEQFVSNLTGSSMLEIVALSVIVPALVVLRQWNAFYTRNDIGLKEKSEDAVPQYKLWRTYMFCLALDFLFVVLPILTFFTVLSDWVYTCALFLLFAIILTLSKRFLSSAFDPGVPHKSSLRSNISSYRVVMMVVTCLCILAVDFKIFPRRYAKAETYGTGLMDLGVGSFVVANSLVSRQARSAISISWKSTIKSTLPLLVLGTIRLLTTAGVDYQVHVGEYGVHWNFFFTLAVVSLLTCLINIEPKYCGVFALTILVAYQICLLCGLNEYLLSKNRGLDIISQNKEGIFSIFGYWGMYLAGVYLGYKVLFQTELMTTKSSPNMAMIRVWGLTILFWVSTVILNEYVEEVSRRMCNLAYVTLVFAQNFQVLAIVTLSDLLPGRRNLVLEEAFNKNLLGIFLLANILTGLINLCVDTLSASSFEAFCILLGYSGFLSAFAGIASFCGIKFKFW